MATAKANRGSNGTAAAASPAPRVHPFGRSPLRTFALVVALPAFLLYVSSAVLAMVALYMMMQDMDRREVDRGTASMHAALISFLNTLSDTVADEGTWNEAHLSVVVAPDPAWMDSTWGATARLGTTYDDVIVTDSAGAIQFGENNLGAISGDIAERYPAAATMLDELDRGIAQSGDAAIVSSFAADGESAVGLAAISIHKSTPGEATVPRNARRVLWIAKHITPALLQDISSRYQTPLATLVTDVPGGDIAFDVLDVDNRMVGTVAWTPDRPGEEAFRQSLITVSAVFFAIGIPLVLGLGLLRRAMVRRAARVEHAFAHAQTAAPATPAATIIAGLDTPPPGVAREQRPSAITGISATNFTMEYQPTLDLRSESMVGVEALLRWVKADGSPLLQEELNAHEIASMMERAGIMALRHAATELGPLLGVVLSLTITPAQLLNGVFAEKVAGTLGATNFQARRLQLSIDTGLLPPAPQLIGPLVELRRLGVLIAFSNFTLGATTAAYMRPGLADRICLDPQIVAGIDEDPVRLKLVEATIEAARAASFAVTVPGIARKEDAAKLLRLGCREFRGELLAPAMPIAALTSLILAPAKPQAKAG